MLMAVAAAVAVAVVVVVVVVDAAVVVLIHCPICFPRRGRRAGRGVRHWWVFRLWSASLLDVGI